MKTIRINERSRYEMLHVEAPGCIINIRVDLTDEDGRAVTRVDVMADGDRYAGDPKWWLATNDLASATPTGLGVRIIREGEG